MRDVAQCPPHRNQQASRPVSGLAGGTSRRSGQIVPAWRLPMLHRVDACTVAVARLVSLTVAGAAPDWMRKARRHRLPVSILGRMPSDHLEARAVYRRDFIARQRDA